MVIFLRQQYPLQIGTPPKKREGFLGMTLNFIQCWGSGNLGNWFTIIVVVALVFEEDFSFWTDDKRLNYPNVEGNVFEVVGVEYHW